MWTPPQLTEKVLAAIQEETSNAVVAYQDLHADLIAKFSTDKDSAQITVTTILHLTETIEQRASELQKFYEYNSKHELGSQYLDEAKKLRGLLTDYPIPDELRQSREVQVEEEVSVATSELLVHPSAKEGVPNTFKTLPEAISHARPGDIINVSPGVYTLNLQIKTGKPSEPITIRAVKSATTADPVVFKAEDGRLPTISVKEGGALVLQSISIEHVTGGQGAAREAACIWVDGFQSYCMVQSCEISKTGGSCVVVDSKATLQMVDSKLREAKGCGVRVKGGSTAELKNTSIRQCSEQGIHVSEKSTASLINCEIGACVHHGAVVIGHSLLHFTLASCILDNKGHGIRVEGGSKLHLDRSYVVGNNRDGVSVTGDSDVQITGGQISTNVEMGINAVSRCKIAVKGTEISNNGRNGVQLCDKTVDINLTECVVTKNSDHGIRATDGARCTVDHCKISENATTGIHISESAQVSILQSEICDQNTGVIVGGSDSLVLLDESKIVRNKGCGMEATFHGAIKAKRSLVAENKANGVYVFNHGSCALDGCTIQQNFGHGVSVYISSRADLVACTIKDKNSTGVYVSDLSHAKLTNCVITGNRVHGISARPTASADVVGGEIGPNSTFDGHREPILCEGDGAIRLRGTMLDSAKVDCTFVEEKKSSWNPFSCGGPRTVKA